MSGYKHSSYAQVLSEFGKPRELPCCGGWILERKTPSLDYRDAMGCYPLFACRDWSQLPCDVESLGTDLVSLLLVTDPFGSFRHDDLSSAFDSVMPYKKHLITNLKEFPKDLSRAKVRRNVSKALKQLDLEMCPEPNSHLEEWISFYERLCVRYHIRGVRAFSPQSFKLLFQVPGLVMFRASHRGETVGLHLWIVSGEVAYGHLGATNQLGYEFMASYALYWYAIEYFRELVTWLDLGAAPDNTNGQESGLLRFKRRWATGTRSVFLCSRIFDSIKYDQLVAITKSHQSGYFPAYRFGDPQ